MLLRWATVPEQSGPKSGGAVPLVVGGWVPISHNVAWAYAYTSVASGILIHPTVRPQYISVTDRKTDRQTDRQENGPITSGDRYL